MNTAEIWEEARKHNVNADALAMLPATYDPARLPPRMGIELKVDGIGFLDVNGHLQSLEGAPFDAAMHLAHELARLRAMFGTEMVLHGEFHERGGFNETVGSFQSGRSTSGSIVLWDAVTLKAWYGFEQSPPLYMRYEALKSAFFAVQPHMLTLSKMVEMNVVHSPADVPLLDLALATALEGGHEGLVVKDLDSPYRRGRSHFWMKVKPVETLDVPIQGTRLDEAGRVKSIIVTVEGKPALIGSGISEGLRHQPEEFPAGRIVEIRHVGRTQKGALRGTSFVRFRDDKVKP